MGMMVFVAKSRWDSDTLSEPRDVPGLDAEWGARCAGPEWAHGPDTDWYDRAEVCHHSTFSSHLFFPRLLLNWLIFIVPFYLFCWLISYNSVLCYFNSCCRVYGIHVSLLPVYLQVTPCHFMERIRTSNSACSFPLRSIAARHSSSPPALYTTLECYYFCVQQSSVF